MEIRYLADHRDHIPAIAQWFFKEWACFYPGKSPKDFEAMIAQRANKGSIPLALIALDGNELLGTGCLKVRDMETRPELTPWLAGIYVAAEQRGRGIGATLVRAVEKEAAALGVRKLYLHTPKSEKFYHNLGWKLVERTEYLGCTVSIMERQISGQP